MGHRLSTRHAPRSPEVEHHDLAAIVFQLVFAAVGVFQSPGWRGGTDGQEARVSRLPAGDGPFNVTLRRKEREVFGVNGIVEAQDAKLVAVSPVIIDAMRKVIFLADEPRRGEILLAEGAVDVLSDRHRMAGDALDVLDAAVFEFGISVEEEIERFVRSELRTSTHGVRT